MARTPTIGELSGKRFKKELEALRSFIASATTPLPKGEARKQRVAACSTDLELFGKTYFPHYLTAPSSKLHKYLYERLKELVFLAIGTGEGSREADAAPRGNAKSTITTVIFPIWCAAYKHRLFALIVSETASQVWDFISAIKVELETNNRLKQDFPELCGEGPIWRSHEIVTNNGVKIRGVGAGKKMRGMRHGAHRPDLVIGDDLENDEAVVSPEQREKLARWFFRALMKIGQPDTVYVVVGTILHYDSLLANLLKKPGWKGRKFRSVIKWATSKLWEEWEALYTEIKDGAEEAERLADAFFAEHKEEMLEGAEVLWPERESYYYLMKMRISEGPAHFDSEKQNEPINPDDCLFKEEWIVYWDENPELDGLPVSAAVDPSLGKKSRKADPSAILAGRFLNGILWLDIADIEKRHPDRIIEDLLMYHERLHFFQAGIEAVQFQEFFAKTVEKISHERGITLNVQEVHQSGDKTLRIQSLQPWVKNGWIRFRKGMTTLVDQLVKFPMADHDDGPDALEMLKSLVEKLERGGEFKVETAVPRESTRMMANY